MPFTFKRKETVTESVRRVGHECLDRAIESAASHDIEAIHATRKEIKKMRALLRLVKKEIGKSCFRKITDQLREAASYLAPPRDAYVRFKALETLARPASRRAAPP
jgi:CHAD domain-containing protein